MPLHGCSLLPWALVALAVLSCPTEASPWDCRGADSCTDETSLMQLSAKVTKGVLKPKGADGTGQSQATPSAHSGSGSAAVSQLQLKASSLANTEHEVSHGRAMTLAQATTSFASASESHMIAYVVLFGILLVLCGLGVFVIMGMKKEDDWYAANPDGKPTNPAEAMSKFAQPQTPQQQYQRPAADMSALNLGYAASMAPSSAPLLAGAGFGLPQNSQPDLGEPMRNQAQSLIPAATLPMASPLAGQQMQGVAQQMQAQQMQMQVAVQQMQGMNQQMPMNPAYFEAPVIGQLCPDLPGTCVPANSQFPMKVPFLLRDIKEDEEAAIVRNVQAKDGTPMFNLKVTRRKPLAYETNHPEEYIRLSLPSDDSRELVLCAFGRPSGKLECHIYQFGKDPWGIIRQDAQPPDLNATSYTLFLRNSSPALTAIVTDTGADRTVRITHAGRQDAMVATASHTQDLAFYEVECYPLCDLILTIVMLTGIHRMSVNSNK